MTVNLVPKGAINASVSPPYRSTFAVANGIAVLASARTEIAVSTVAPPSTAHRCRQAIPRRRGGVLPAC